MLEANILRSYLKRLEIQRNREGDKPNVLYKDSHAIPSSPLCFHLSLSSLPPCTRILLGIITRYSLLWYLSCIIRHTVSLTDLNSLHKSYFQGYLVWVDTGAPGISQSVPKSIQQKKKKKKVFLKLFKMCSTNSLQGISRTDSLFNQNLVKYICFWSFRSYVFIILPATWIRPKNSCYVKHSVCTLCFHSLQCKSSKFNWSWKL